jgi:VanZ family protein
MPARFTNGVGDRAADQPLVAGDLTKPSVLSRRTQRWLCAASLALIIYGTLGPLGVHQRPWLATAPDWSWVPPQRHSDGNDLLTNIVVYVPVGLCFRLLLRRRGRAGWRDLVPAWLLSVALSYGTELLQQFMPARSANLLDVYVNAAAAFLGCLVAAPMQSLARQAHARAFDALHSRRGLWTSMLWLLLAVTFVIMTSPWRLHRPTMVLGLEEPSRLTDHLWLGRFAAFASIGFVIAGRALLSGREPQEILLRTVVRVGGLALLLELAQAALSEHTSSLLHAAMAAAGTACGALVALRCVRSRPAPPGTRAAPNPRPPVPAIVLPGPHTRRVVLALLIIVLLYATVSSALLHAPTHGARTEPAFSWIPFRAHFETSFSHMLADVFQQCVLYGFLTFLCLYLTHGRGRLAALLLLLGMLGTVEAGQAFVRGHGTDTTAFVLAAFAWGVTTRLWGALYPRRTPAEGVRIHAT